jgi:adenine-specific DNA-methyltransferase
MGAPIFEEIPAYEYAFSPNSPYFQHPLDNIRIPEMTWDNVTRAYVLLESPKANEEVIFPIKNKNGEKIEKNWQRGHERVKVELPMGEYRIRRTVDGDIQIDFKTRMDEGSLPITWWDDNRYASANYGALELKDLFLESNFDFPKSKQLVTDCLKAIGIAEPKSIIVDFFAGSGTTAHSIMDLNRNGIGNSKYM